MRFFLISIAIFFGGFARAQDFTIDDYSKREVIIQMRDGIKLFTTIYQPKDQSQAYPVLMIRTPYSVKPYGKDTMPEKLMHNPDLVASGYIFVEQDMRGRWMSEGAFENTKPPYSWKDSTKTDEALQVVFASEKVTNSEPSVISSCCFLLSIALFLTAWFGRMLIRRNVFIMDLNEWYEENYVKPRKLVQAKNPK